MSIAGAPLQLASGQGVQLSPPQTGVQLAAVVLSNESPYRLTVTTGATTYSQPPFTAQLYRLDLTNQNIGVLPQLPDGATAPDGSSTDLVPTWYQNDEVPTGVYPISLTAQAIAAAIAGSVTTKFEGALLYSGQVDQSAPVGLQVDQWASLQVNAASQGGLVSGVILDVTWYADAAHLILLGTDQINLPVASSSVQRNIAVRAPYVELTCPGSVVTSVQVYASNRNPTVAYIGTQPADDFRYEGDLFAGTRYILNSQLSSLQTYYSNGGPASMRFVVTAGGGRFGWRITNPYTPGTSFDVLPYPVIPLAGSTATEAYASGVIPAGLLVPIFECAITATGVTLDWEIVTTA